MQLAFDSISASFNQGSCMSSKIVAGNWKSNGSRQMLASYLERLGQIDAPRHDVQVIIAPPSVYVREAVLQAPDFVDVAVQNCSAEGAGAFTGEITAEMVVDVGARWVIVGHSERRQYYAEDDKVVAAKVARSLEVGLRVILCVGETLQQRESGQAQSVVLSQLKAGISALTSLEGLTVAYEPVWAIGTGKVALPEDAQAMHAAIREDLLRSGLAGGAAVRLLYGGSVKASNAAELFAQPDIDGALVGGASLNVDEFLAIVAAC